MNDKQKLINLYFEIKISPIEKILLEEIEKQNKEKQNG